MKPIIPAITYNLVFGTVTDGRHPTLGVVYVPEDPTPAATVSRNALLALVEKWRFRVSRERQCADVQTDHVYHRYEGHAEMLIECARELELILQGEVASSPPC